MDIRFMENIGKLGQRMTWIGLPLLISLFVIFCLSAASVATDNYYYDANGNLARDVSANRCYEYNNANKLSKVTNCGSTTIAEYWYDYTGRKVKAIEDGVTILYPFEDTEVRVNGSNLDTTIYFFANGERVAMKDPHGHMHYFHNDQLGSTNVVTDQNGNVEEKTNYYPFGATRSGGTKSKYLFNSKELEAATGLYDYGGRQYKSDIFHFIEPDPVIPNPYDPQSLNRYSYVKNNPVKYVDPTGQSCFVPGALGPAGVQLNGYYKQFVYDPVTSAINTMIEDSDKPENQFLLIGSMDAPLGAGTKFVKAFKEAAKIKQAQEIAGTAEAVKFDVPSGLKPTERGRVVESLKLGQMGLEPYRGNSLTGFVEGKAVNFKPDYLTSSSMGEIKDVNYLSATKQIRAEIDYASANKLSYSIYVRSDTKMSAPLLHLVKEQNYKIVNDLGYCMK